MRKSAIWASVAACAVVTLSLTGVRAEHVFPLGPATILLITAKCVCKRIWSWLAFMSHQLLSPCGRRGPHLLLGKKYFGTATKAALASQGE